MKNKDHKNTIDLFWNQVYKDLDDGGYISDDTLLNNYRFIEEKRELVSFINKYVDKKNRHRALDVGCGNGKFTRVMAKYFEKVDAIDISQDIIRKNIENNIKDNCTYYCKDLESFSKINFTTYDFIYVGGVLMYIEDDKLSESYQAMDGLLANNSILVLRESVMTRKRVNNITKNYIAFYRDNNFYESFLTLDFVKKKQNMAYRIAELNIVLTKLKLGFLFKKDIYQKMFVILKIKDLLWKPSLNKLVNYYYVYRKEK